MLIPENIIVNADDFGLRPSINQAIVNCFEKGYINSTSFLTNTAYFENTVYLINQTKVISNIGVHVDLAEGKPVTNFDKVAFLNHNGNWNLRETDKKIRILDRGTKASFTKEIYAQIDKALAANITVTHLDSHHHLHTLPCFYPLFLQAAKHYNLKLRLAQTTNEGSYIKFFYRKYINQQFKANDVQYSDYFENVYHFLSNGTHRQGIIEIMLHPDLNTLGKLTDHCDASEMENWISFLQKSNA